MTAADIKVGDAVHAKKARQRMMRVVEVLPGPEINCRMPDGREVAFDPEDLERAGA
ncbi:hypothetical protein CLV24_105104 [Pontibacter ummariensis]|uniref:Uncharacterized protein n=1 Tax=Pontibacter ummariensis TaxID=1610492 RepID=A0A239DXT0_9BACT|nr:hypothetical protein [Pontibacter ummariensis]PRY13734.1 hypothetical protein CLV24_105104 [Pontibacter ummariensis]SNS36454.1 hypothetical protein SAMN06296052_105147 [Pontibacter ummariensis]